MRRGTAAAAGRGAVSSTRGLTQSLPFPLLCSGRLISEALARASGNYDRAACRPHGPARAGDSMHDHRHLRGECRAEKAPTTAPPPPSLPPHPTVRSFIPPVRTAEGWCAARGMRAAGRDDWRVWPLVVRFRRLLLLAARVRLAWCTATARRASRTAKAEGASEI